MLWTIDLKDGWPDRVEAETAVHHASCSCCPCCTRQLPVRLLSRPAAVCCSGLPILWAPSVRVLPSGAFCAVPRSALLLTQLWAGSDWHSLPPSQSHTARHHWAPLSHSVGPGERAGPGKRPAFGRAAACGPGFCAGLGRGQPGQHGEPARGADPLEDGQVEDLYECVSGRSLIPLPSFSSAESLRQWATGLPQAFCVCVSSAQVARRDRQPTQGRLNRSC